MELTKNPKTELSLTKKVAAILIVEADATMRPFWKSVLDRIDQKCEFFWSEDEETAEKIIRAQFEKNQPIDLVITDIYLAHGKTGFDLLKDCKAYVKDFAFASSMTPSRFRNLMGSHAEEFSFLWKPLDPFKCVALINNLIRETNSQR